VVPPGLVIYEPFDYPAGLLDNPTVDNAGGLGLLGAWTGNDAQVIADGLGYTAGGLTLVAAGRSALLPRDTYATIIRAVDPAAFPADMRDTAGFVGAAGKELWLSMVAYADTTDPNGQSFTLSLDDSTAPTAGLMSSATAITAPAPMPITTTARKTSCSDRSGLCNSRSSLVRRAA